MKEKAIICLLMVAFWVGISQSIQGSLPVNPWQALVIENREVILPLDLSGEQILELIKKTLVEMKIKDFYFDEEKSVFICKTKRFADNFPFSGPSTGDLIHTHIRSNWYFLVISVQPKASRLEVTIAKTHPGVSPYPGKKLLLRFVNKLEKNIKIGK
ncbi:MAG: hypothetical protein DRJ06_01550 [Candidatus Aminicenantes bacterium]|nr:MAG: hypothetical protein DRJ06_01550 [Candidatus Aminicenantes bacterium]